MSMQLVKDKVCIITGGTSGIGYCAAGIFLENGAQVAVFGLTDEEVQETLGKLKERFPDRELMGFAPKIGSREEVTAAVNQVAEKFGRLDVMINNAGITNSDVFSKVTEEAFRESIEVNMVGVFNGAWAAYQVMKKQNSGVIINTASVAGVFGSLSGAPYPASKAGVVGLTMELGRELVRKNIRVVGVAPGTVDTPMTQGLPPEILEGYLKTLPQKRMQRPEEIANVYLFLASDLASGITATTISVDGAYRP